jgi:AAA domain-containing protein
MSNLKPWRRPGAEDRPVSQDLPCRDRGIHCAAHDSCETAGELMTKLHHSANLAEINPFREVYNCRRKTRTPELICLADVAPRSVGWLWSLRVPLGMLTLISSDPGCGKTYLALSIAAALSLGRLPDPRTVKPASTIYWSRENPIAEPIRPRFDTLGGDPSRFFIRQSGSLADTESLEFDVREEGIRLSVSLRRCAVV